ncbi:hypothetical protein QUA82_26105 [Microcoleus sp. F8-D3]
MPSTAILFSFLNLMTKNFLMVPATRSIGGIEPKSKMEIPQERAFISRKSI